MKSKQKIIDTNVAGVQSKQKKIIETNVAGAIKENRNITLFK